MYFGKYFKNENELTLKENVFLLLFLAIDMTICNHVDLDSNNFVQIDWRMPSFQIALRYILRGQWFFRSRNPDQMTKQLEKFKNVKSWQVYISDSTTSKLRPIKTVYLRPNKSLTNYISYSLELLLFHAKNHYDALKHGPKYQSHYCKLFFISAALF